MGNMCSETGNGDEAAVEAVSESGNLPQENALVVASVKKPVLQVNAAGTGELPPKVQAYHFDQPKARPVESLQEYEKLATEVPFELPQDFPTSALRAFFLNKVRFKFRLKEYPGAGNPVSRLEEKDMLFVGQVRTETDGRQVKEGMGYLQNKSHFFAGYFANNLLNGPAVMVTDGDMCFRGIWTDNVMGGFGVYSRADELVYEGDWKHNLQDGFGREEWLGNTTYEGQFRDGYKHGFGELRWVKEGCVYRGEFKKDCMDGTGEYVWQDGKKYKGEWREKKIHGKGRFDWPDGRYYEGEYVNNVKEGLGTLSWPDGRKFQGQWKAGKQNGHGEYTDKDGKVSRGVWKDGKPVRTEG